MTISERLLTIVVLCLLAAAVPAFANGSAEARLKQAQELLADAQAPLKQAQDLLADAQKSLAQDPIEKAQLEKAKELIAQATSSLREAMSFITQAQALIDEVREGHPDLPELPATMLNLARAMIDARQFTEAWNEVLALITDYPDFRKETDSLIARIMEVQRQFNELLAELNAIIPVPPTIANTARGTAIILAMEALFPTPDPGIPNPYTDQITKARNEFARREENVQFRKVMDDAAVLLAAGRYADAIEVYLAGFAISRETFDNARYPALLKDQAGGLVAQIDSASREIAAGIPDIAALSGGLDSLLATPVDTTLQDGFLRSLERLTLAADREARLRALGERIPGLQSGIVLADGDEDYWLNRIKDYTMGRAVAAPEGLVFAARGAWILTSRTLSGSTVAAADAAAAKLSEGFAGEARVAAFRPLAVEARSRSSLAIRVIEVESSAGKQAGVTPGSEEAARLAVLPAILGQLRQHIADADAWEAFTAIRDQATAAIADLERALQAIRPVPDAAGLRSGRASATTVREAAVAGAGAWGDRLASAAGSVMAAQATSVRDGYAEVASAVLTLDAALAHDLAALEASGFAARLADAETRKVQGDNLVSGTVQGISGKRPDLGNDQYVRALADIVVLLSDIDAWFARWSAEPSYVSASPAMTTELGTQAALRVRIIALQSAIAGVASAARSALALAVQLRGQGDTAFQAGQNEDKARKFTDALASYTTAQKSYSDSLAQQENAAARARLAELPAIIRDLIVKVLAQQLAEIQVLIDRGIQQFLDRDYEGAVATLETAQSLWEKVAGGENPTITTYLERAKAAQKVSGKQEITPSDTIYVDIRGFMTQAELSYNAAVSLQKSAGGSEEYRNAIASARTSVQAITAVVPEYREARLLSLKLDRLEQGEDGFIRELRKRVDASLADARNTRAGEIVLRDAYYSLKDYKAINGIETILTAAKRRDIDTAIVNLERALGLRPPEIPAGDIAASANLYQKALTEYRRNVNDRVLWERALDLLQRSLALNPRNTDAQKLRDQIVLKRGDLDSLLSEAELASYLVAVQDFVSRNYATAEARVDELLKTRPRNKLLLELKRQIQATR